MGVAEKTLQNILKNSRVTNKLYTIVHLNEEEIFIITIICDRSHHHSQSPEKSLVVFLIFLYIYQSSD